MSLPSPRQWAVPGERWRLLAPGEAIVVRSRLGSRTAVRELRALPSGTSVVVLDGLPAARGRVRRLAAAGRLAVEREYVAVPSLRNPLLVVEDVPQLLGWACRSIIAPPPGVTRFHALLDVAVRLLRRGPHLLATMASGRVVVGRRR